MDYMDLVDRNWPFLHFAIKGHTAAYRLTNGLIGHRPPGAPPMLLLDHTGAKSATKRTTPLVYGEDGENLVLVASKGGFPKNPAWFYNLKANPETSVQVGSRHFAVRAREAEQGEEYERLWKLMVGVYRGYESYRRRTERRIPLIVLEPRGE